MDVKCAMESFDFFQRFDEYYRTRTREEMRCRVKKKNEGIVLRDIIKCSDPKS